MSRALAIKKLLLLANLLCSRGLINQTQKAIMKEMILRGDTRLDQVLAELESENSNIGGLQELLDAETRHIYASIFANCPLDKGKHLSKSERESKGLVHEKSLIYGEVDYENFLHSLRKVDIPAGGTFVDLGSGTARAIFAARLNFDFGRCVGVELLDSLFRASQEVVAEYKTRFQHFMAPQFSDVAVHNGDLLEFQWSRADVVFANSTCFDDSLMTGMSRTAEQLRPGAIFITFTKSLNSDQFRILHKERLDMSWGAATVFIQERVDPAAPASGRDVARAEYFDDVASSSSSDDEPPARARARAPAARAPASPPARSARNDPRRPGSLVMRAPGIEAAQRPAASSPQGDSLLKRKHLRR